MIKWFVYIVFALILIPWLSFAKITRPVHRRSENPTRTEFSYFIDSAITAVADTTPKKQNDDKKKIKEVTKAKPVPKPEKVGDGTTPAKAKPKRQRRPPGLERPPEIPRHNGD
ncbi:MAG: hypothetical protein ACHQHN_07820 [Sphingobacteriales bacterium]